MDKYRLLLLAFFTGFIGDGILQIIINNDLWGKSNWGLKDYFSQHGSAESMFIAGGMLTLFYAAYIASGLPINILTMTIYGIVLDVIFRKTMLFKSLDKYYESLNYFFSGLWGVIPMIIPLVLDSMINKLEKRSNNV